MKTEGHLGGYIAGGDPATYFPELWRWCVSDLGVQSVLDLGCGEGHALSYFHSLGCDVVGVDGVRQPDPRIKTHDFERQGAHPERREFDLVWTCEFLEHVEEAHAPNLVPSLRDGKIVLMTHAFPGQMGYHHVNCQPSEYWRGFMTAAGFLFDQELTDVTKSVASVNKSPYNHYVRAGMAFRRQD